VIFLLIWHTVMWNIWITFNGLVFSCKILNMEELVHKIQFSLWYFFVYLTLGYHCSHYEWMMEPIFSWAGSSLCGGLVWITLRGVFGPFLGLCVFFVGVGLVLVMGRLVAFVVGFMLCVAFCGVVGAFFVGFFLLSLLVSLSCCTFVLRFLYLYNIYFPFKYTKKKLSIIYKRK